MKGPKLRDFSNFIVLIAYFLVPIFNIFRMDIANGSFYVFRKRFSLDESVVLLLSVLFLVLFFVSITKWFGRQFCGWMCPHSTFSGYLLKCTTKIKFLKKRPKLATFVDLILSIVAAPFISFALFAYFYDPMQLFTMIKHGDLLNGLGGSYIGITILFFYLIHSLKFKFCRTVCPYGKLQMLFSDKKPKKGIKHIFKGINLLLLIIMLVLTGTLVYTALQAKGYNMELSANLSGVQVENNVLYTYNLKLENYQTYTDTYTITYKDVPKKWGDQLPSKVTVKPNASKKLAIVFRVPPEDLGKNYVITITAKSQNGNEITKTQSIFPQKF